MAAWLIKCSTNKKWMGGWLEPVSSCWKRKPLVSQKARLQGTPGGCGLMRVISMSSFVYERMYIRECRDTGYSAYTDHLALFTEAALISGTNIEVSLSTYYSPRKGTRTPYRNI